MSKGLHVHIVQAMKQHNQDAGVQRWGCRALRGLSLSGYADKEILIKCGVLEVAFNHTQRYCHNFSVEPFSNSCQKNNTKLIID